MSKLLNWGRWIAGLFFALEGFAILVGIESIVIFLAVRGEGTVLYPGFTALIAGLILFACAWGLMNVRRWAYGLAVAIAIFEGVATPLMFALSGGRFSGASFYFVGWTFYFGPGLLLAGVFAFIFLIWLLIPTVSARYLHREIAA